MRAQFTQALPLGPYESYNKNSPLVIRSQHCGIILSQRCVFWKSGPEVSDQQITPGFRPPLCARKTGRNIVGFSSYWRNLRGPSSIFLTLRACPCWYLWGSFSDYRWPAVFLIQVPNILTLIPCFFSGSEDWNYPLLCCQTRTCPTSTLQRPPAHASAHHLTLSGHGGSHGEDLPAPVHHCDCLR